MSNPEIRKIVIIGAGRLAINLSMVIHKKGYELAEVCNRSEIPGKALAKRVNAHYIPMPGMITPDADLYIVCVSDAVIEEVLSKINTDHFIVHTSGTVGIDVLKKVSQNYGVLYPLQTFTFNRLNDCRTVPLCIEANTENNLEILKHFAESLSENVYVANSGQRRILHLSAVFANNFTNFMYSISQELLKENEMDFRILAPIIMQTAENASSMDIFELQTGPAVRGDMDTIRKHQELLSNHPEYKEIYDLITRNIIQLKMNHEQL